VRFFLDHPVYIYRGDVVNGCQTLTLRYAFAQREKNDFRRAVFQSLTSFMFIAFMSPSLISPTSVVDDASVDKDRMKR